jgi:hypothetical protein
MLDWCPVWTAYWHHRVTQSSTLAEAAFDISKLYGIGWVCDWEPTSLPLMETKGKPAVVVYRWMACDSIQHPPSGGAFQLRPQNSFRSGPQSQECMAVEAFPSRILVGWSAGPIVPDLTQRGLCAASSTTTTPAIFQPRQPRKRCTLSPCFTCRRAQSEVPLGENYVHYSRICPRKPLKICAEDIPGCPTAIWKNAFTSIAMMHFKD